MAKEIAKTITVQLPPRQAMVLEKYCKLTGKTQTAVVLDFLGDALAKRLKRLSEDMG